MDVIGVVPIFMSAGAAALPTLLAAVTSVAAILLKPRELLRICRQKRPLAVVDHGGRRSGRMRPLASGGGWRPLPQCPARRRGIAL